MPLVPYLCIRLADWQQQLTYLPVECAQLPEIRDTHHQPDCHRQLWYLCVRPCAD